MVFSPIFGGQYIYRWIFINYLVFTDLFFIITNNTQRLSNIIEIYIIGLELSPVCGTFNCCLLDALDLLGSHWAYTVISLLTIVSALKLLSFSVFHPLNINPSVAGF